MNRFLINRLLIIAIFVFANSCINRKNLAYFQGSTEINGSVKNYNPSFQVNDLISIVVTGVDAETVKPFNLPVTNAMVAGGYNQGSQPPPGYLIDYEGNIDFPLIGKIRVAGLNRNLLADTLKARLKSHLANPTISIRILNFKVTILGEVRSPGTFTIPNEKVTLTEALGIAGDLLITGKRKNVLVIRESEGKRIEYRVDLTSKNLFDSPVYYLNQNDVVYVEPNRAKMNSSVVNAANVGIIISAVSLIITVVIVLRGY